MVVLMWFSFVSSPEPSGSHGELIVYPWSGVRRRRPSIISNIFSSEIAWPIKAKNHLEPPLEGGTKLYIMIQVTWPSGRHARHLKKSSPEPLSQLTWNLACSIRVCSTTKFYKSWPLVDLDLFYGKVNFGSMCIWMGKAENFHFSVAIVL